MKPGDVVTLTAGSDPMTVEMVTGDDDNIVHCAWFPVTTYAVDPQDERTFAIYGTLQRAVFPAAALEDIHCSECGAKVNGDDDRPGLTVVD